MGDGADMLREAEETEELAHLSGHCALDDGCYYCRQEHNAEMRAPASIDELKDIEDD
jgi:hypothetical protein